MTPDLTDEAKAVLAQSDEQRIRYLQTPNWIEHDRVKAIHHRLDDLLQHPKSHRMPNLLVHGEPGSGKTMVLSEFSKKHPPKFRRTDGLSEVPVLFTTCPPGTTEVGLYANILDRLSSPYGSTKDAIRLRSQVLHLLRLVGVKVLMLDEIHHFVNGAVAKQRYILTVLKYLGNELQIPIVAAGTKDALQVIRSDDQMASRFDAMPLPPWVMGPDYIRLLMAFERRLPLRQTSELMSKELANQLLIMSGGQIGEMFNILSAAAQSAIRDGSEKITPATLKNTRRTTLLGSQSSLKLI